MSYQYPPPNGSEYQGAPQYSPPPQYQRPTSQQPHHQGQPYPGPQHFQGPGGSQPSPYAPPPAPVKGKPPLWLGIVVLCLAPVLAVLGLVVAIVIGQQQMDQEISESIPGTAHQLEANTIYTLYAPEDDGVQASGCTVLNPERDQITLSPNATTTQTDPDGVTYQEIGEFTTDQAGSYLTLCAGSFDTVVLAGTGFVTMGLGLILAILVGLGLGAVGIVLIVINRVTAARARRQNTPPGAYPTY